MNVLPHRATLQPFFAVTAVIVFITGIFIFFLGDMIITAKRVPQRFASFSSFAWHYQYTDEFRAFDTRLYDGYAGLLARYDKCLVGFDAYQYCFVASTAGTHILLERTAKARCFVWKQAHIRVLVVLFGRLVDISRSTALCFGCRELDIVVPMEFIEAGL